MIHCMMDNDHLKKKQLNELLVNHSPLKIDLYIFLGYINSLFPKNEPH